jgi:16S rRNA (adenine(1408)-N(1))-methyltransferase
MRVASQRASARQERGGLPNALFFVAAVEALPSALTGIADEVTVHYPWGSLFRGIVLAEASVLSSIARHAKPDAAVRALVSFEPRDGLPGLEHSDIPSIAARADRFARHGLSIAELRLARPEEVAAAHSTWSRRLAFGARRTTWLLRLERSAERERYPVASLRTERGSRI